MMEAMNVSSTRPRAASKAGRLAALAGIAIWCGSACAQAPAQQPLDINNPKPAAVVPKAAEKPQAAAADSAAVSGAPVAADGNSYKVSRFLIEWHVANEQHPPSDELLDATVTLGVTPKGYVSALAMKANSNVLLDKNGVAIPRSGVNTTTLKVRDLVSGGGGTFFASALRDVNDALVKEMHRRGFIAVFVHAAEDQIAQVETDEHQAGDDLRDGKTEELRLIIWTGQVAQVRSVASGPRLEGAIIAEQTTRVDSSDPVHTRIREQSPVKPGDLVHRDQIDEYLFRLNRHPGRRVDVAVAAGEKPEEVVIDYLVSENKPWTAYVQLSNTGTSATNEWRERFGFIHNQLTKHDDTLRLDYSTANFDESHAVNLDYEFPILSDSIKARVYGGYSEYSASDVGFASESFTGHSWNGGGELVGNVLQHHDLFLDVTAGVKWQCVEVFQSVKGETGSDNFWTPYLGVSLERFTDESSLTANATISWNADSLDQVEKDKLGRFDVDKNFTIIRFGAERSVFLEPVFNRLGWFQGDDGKGYTSLAHEIAVSARGQWTGNRLMPTEEEVAGGMNSVRGYPESVAAGDNVFIGSLEYRFHLPNSFSLSDPGHIGKQDMPTWFGKDFRWAPQQAFARADWDLIFKGFFDMASVHQSQQQFGEVPSTLFSTGIGAELTFKRNVSLRLDWGVALKDAGQEKINSTEREVSAGDSRLHFMMTVSY